MGLSRLRTLYVDACHELGCSVNSAFDDFLASKRGPLTELDLSYNYVGARGIQPALRVFEESPTITKLNVRKNGLEDPSVKMVVEACRGHLGITSLDVSANPCTQEGGLALLDLVTTNDRMVDITVEDTDIYDALVKRIYMAANTNREKAALRPKLVSAPLKSVPKRTTPSLFANPDAWQSYVVRQEQCRVDAADKRHKRQGGRTSVSPIGSQKTASSVTSSRPSSTGRTSLCTNPAFSPAPTLGVRTVANTPAPTTTDSPIPQLPEMPESILQHNGALPPGTQGQRAVRKRQEERRRVEVEQSLEDRAGPKRELRELKAEQQRLEEEDYYVQNKDIIDSQREAEEKSRAEEDRKWKAQMDAVAGDMKANGDDDDGGFLGADNADDSSAPTASVSVASPPTKHLPPIEPTQAVARPLESDDKIGVTGSAVKQREYERMSAMERYEAMRVDQAEHGQLKLQQIHYAAQQQPHEAGGDDRAGTPPAAAGAPTQPQAPKRTPHPPSGQPPKASRPHVRADSTVIDAANSEPTDVPRVPAFPVPTESDVSFAPDIDSLPSFDAEEGDVDAQKFKAVFDRAGLDYERQEYDGAYDRWMEALEVAKDCGNRNWVAVVQSNLNALSFYLLMSQAQEHFQAGGFQEGLQCCRLAAEVASKARKPKQEHQAEQAIVQAHIQMVSSLHDQATALFDQLVDMQLQSSPQPDAPEDVQHIFEHEWSRVLLVKEALEKWAGALELHRVLDVVGKSEMEVALITSVDCLFVYAYKVLFSPNVDRTPRQSGLHTSDYTPEHRRKFLEIWQDIGITASKVQNPKWVALVHAILGNLHFSVFGNTPALNHMTQYIQICQGLEGHMEMLAAGLTMIGNMYLQNKLYGDAEKALVEASTIWATLRPAFGSSPTTMSPVTFIVEQQVSTFEYLQQVYVHQSRYREALEMAERAKSHNYYDRLSDKLHVNFGREMSVDQMCAVAQKHSTVLVVYSVVYVFEWNEEVDDMEYLEVLLVWVLPKDGEIKFVQMDVTAEYNVDTLQRLVQEARQALGVEGGPSPVDGVITKVDDLTPNWRQHFQHLFDFLMYPVIDFITTSGGLDNRDMKVTFIPHSYLWLIPFPALMDSTGEFLIERFAVSVSPSVQMLAYAQVVAEKVSDGHLTHPSSATQHRVIGDINPSSHITVPLALESNTDVPFAATALRTPPLVGEDATRVALAQCLQHCRFLHLGSPVLPAVRSRGVWGAVALTPQPNVPTDHGLVFSSEIQRMDTRCDMAVVSNANMSRQAALMGGDGVIQLMRALVCSGVACVVSTQWALPDYDSTNLLQVFYQEALSGTDKSIAMAHAMRYVIQSTTTVSPAEWAAYLVTGSTPVPTQTHR